MRSILRPLSPLPLAIDAAASASALVYRGFSGCADASTIPQQPARQLISIPRSAPPSTTSSFNFSCAPSFTSATMNAISSPPPYIFHHGIRERGGTICYAALPVAIGRSSRHRELTSSIVPRGTPFHHRVELDFLLLRSASQNAHAAAASRVQRNSVPSTQIRCMITANRRASATIAFFIPRRLAICIAHALSQDHFFTCTSMLWAAS